MADSTADVRRFDPRTIKSDRIVLFLGRRGGGKTTAMLDIMYHLRDQFTGGVVMSGTEAGNGTWSGIVPQSFIYNKYRGDVVREMCREQLKRQQENRCTPQFLILEDCLYDKTLRTDEALRWVFMNGRHAKLFCLISMQYYASMGPELRSQIDYLICTRQRSHAIKKAMWDHFFGMIPDLDSFNRVFDTITGPPFNLLALNNVVESNSLQDCVFWYKARPGHDFTLGDRAYWEFHFANMRMDPRAALEKASRIVGSGHRATVEAMGGRSAIDMDSLSAPPVDDDLTDEAEAAGRARVRHVALLPGYRSKV